MAKKSDLYPSKWLKVADLPETGLVVTILRVDQEQIADETELKPVVSFREAKSLVLNVTNFDVIAAWFGDDTDGWAGKRIRLYRTQVKYLDKMVDAIRVVPKPVKIPAPPEIGPEPIVDDPAFETA